jgi:Leucine-rich repeat (LRR) protein
MSGIETLLITVLGPAIAKSILKVWLKDKTIAQDVSSALVDILKKKTEDALAQKSGNRVFEGIGEKVALSLKPHFEGFSEKQALLVGRMVSESLDRAEITAEFLAQRNLDPVALAQHILDTVKPAMKLNKAAQSLYKRIVTEACQHIIDVASSLPSFTEKSFGEVLKREDEIKQMALEVVNEVRQLRKKVEEQNPEAEGARFEADYRRAITRQLDCVEIFGVDLSRTSKRQELSVAYISLCVEEANLGRFPEQQALVSEDTSWDDEDEQTAVVLPIEEALGDADRMLIRGDAGSGKTTLLQWIAVQSAQGRFRGALESWNDTVPFFIRLRRFSDAPLPQPEAFAGHATPSIAAEMPELWVHDKLRSGKAIVLIDGVDEVSQDKRQAVRDWVRELVTSFPESRYIVTSRFHAVQEGWIEEEQFEDAELQPMDLAEIHAFIEHWHNAVCESLDDDEQIDTLPELVQNLKAVIEDPRTPIRKLATSPLLCAMICAMHRDRRQQLPQDRIELYEAASYMLLERRDIERGLSFRDYPVLKYRQKRALLEDLAYWMIKNELSEVDVAEATDRLSRKLPNMSDIERTITADDVLRLFVERSGIVREVVKGRIDFAHRTFQEYLAAQNALDEEDIGLLVKNAHNDQWRQVMVVAVGLGSAKQRDKLITQLIERGDEEKEHRHELFLLAAACLEVALELNQQTKDEVVKRMKQIVPPRNLPEAKQLAGAGDLAVPLLTYSDQKVRITRACVRTLGLIGTENAVETLRAYAEDERKVIVQELYDAAHMFAPSVQYVERVLSRWTTLRLSGRMGLPEWIGQLTNLRSLTIEKQKELTSLPESIGQIPHLQILTLNICPELSSLPDSIGQLTNLQTLKLQYCYELKTLPESITQLTNLQNLTLRYCSKLTSLPESVGQLTNLQSLALSRGDPSPLLESIARFTNLRSLTLRGHNLMFPPKSIAQLISLESLTVNGPSSKSLLEWIVKLTNLQNLALTDPEATSLPESIVQLSNLQTLYLRSCSQLASLPGSIGQLTNLQSLTLDHCPALPSLPGSIGQLTNLQTLTLNHCASLASVPESIGQLRNLKSVTARGCTQLLASLKKLLPDCKIKT